MYRIYEAVVDFERLSYEPKVVLCVFACGLVSFLLLSKGGKLRREPGSQRQRSMSPSTKPRKLESAHSDFISSKSLSKYAKTSTDSVPDPLSYDDLPPSCHALLKGSYLRFTSTSDSGSFLFVSISSHGSANTLYSGLHQFISDPLAHSLDEVSIEVNDDVTIDINDARFLMSWILTNIRPYLDHVQKISLVLPTYLVPQPVGATALKRRVVDTPQLRHFTWIGDIMSLPAPWFRLSNISLNQIRQLHLLKCNVSLSDCLDLLYNCPRISTFEIDKLSDCASVLQGTFLRQRLHGHPVVPPELSKLVVTTSTNLISLWLDLEASSLFNITLRLSDSVAQTTSMNDFCFNWLTVQTLHIYGLLPLRIKFELQSEAGDHGVNLVFGD